MEYSERGNSIRINAEGICETKVSDSDYFEWGECLVVAPQRSSSTAMSNVGEDSPGTDNLDL